jgi:hypothetical protein
MEKFEQLQEEIQNTIFMIDDAEILAKILEYAKVGKDVHRASKKLAELELKTLQKEEKFRHWRCIECGTIEITHRKRSSYEMLNCRCGGLFRGVN